MVRRKVLSIFVIGMMLIFFATSAWAAYNMLTDAKVYEYSNHQAKKNYPVTLQVKVIKDVETALSSDKVSEY